MTDRSAHMTKEAEWFTAKLIERLDYIEAHADEGGTGSPANLHELTAHIRALLRDRDAWKSDAISMQGQLHVLRAAAVPAPDAGPVERESDEKPWKHLWQFEKARYERIIKTATDAIDKTPLQIAQMVIDEWCIAGDKRDNKDLMIRAIELALLSRSGAGEPVAAIDFVDVSGWSAWMGHAMPMAVARHIAAKVNEDRAAPSLKDQFERVITSLQYQSGVNGDEDSLTVGEIRRAL